MPQTSLQPNRITKHQQQKKNQIKSQVTSHKSQTKTYDRDTSQWYQPAIIPKKKVSYFNFFLKEKTRNSKGGGGNTDNVAYKPQRVIKTDNVRRRSTKPRFAVGI